MTVKRCLSDIIGEVEGDPVRRMRRSAISRMGLHDFRDTDLDVNASSIAKPVDSQILNICNNGTRDLISSWITNLLHEAKEDDGASIVIQCQSMTECELVYVFSCDTFTFTVPKQVSIPVGDTRLVCLEFSRMVRIHNSGFFALECRVII